LEFALKQGEVGTNGVIVTLVGRGIKVSYRSETPVGKEWTGYRVRLKEGWGWVREDGRVAGREELAAVLSELMSVTIGGRFGSGTDWVGLDGVALRAPVREGVPELGVVVGSEDGVVTIEWPANVVGYELEAATSVTEAAWSREALVISATIVEGKRRVTVAMPTATQFYRLSKP
jgi:hypothetical protein